MAGHRILVVDDNPAIRVPLVSLLENTGFSARGVGNGREALRTLREGYDACLILLDLTMPIMDGWKFRKAQRDDPALASIPVAVLTTLRDPAAEAAKLEAVAGFAKPLDCAALLRLVSQHCPKGHAERRYRMPASEARPPAARDPDARLTPHSGGRSGRVS